MAQAMDLLKTVKFKFVRHFIDGGGIVERTHLNGGKQTSLAKEDGKAIEWHDVVNKDYLSDIEYRIHGDYPSDNLMLERMAS